MAETFNPGAEENAIEKAPEGGISKDSSEEARLAIENQEINRDRFKKAFEAFSVELGASATMYYELTPDERDGMMQKMLDIYRDYRDLAFKNVKNNKRKGMEYMNSQ